MATTIIVPSNVMVTSVARVVSTTCEDGDWYKTDGVEDEDLFAAYLAKGASSYANSKLNLVDEESYELTEPISTPAWDSVNGWKFNSDWLMLTVPETQNATFIFRFSNVSQQSYAGCNFTGKGLIYPCYDTGEGGPYVVAYKNTSNSTSPEMSSGVLCFTCSVTQFLGYKNGNLDITLSGTTPEGNEDITFGIGSIYIQAVAVYNKILTATQIAAITDKMEAL